jgi:two-component system LytT family response regulator
VKIRVIIADDEPLARERIRSLLAEQTKIQIVGECVNGAETLKAVRELSADLLFLDVQMPKLTGFEVIEALGDGPLPAIIFTTAHDEHAIRAFEVNAVDYLLKPFTEARFKMAVERAFDELKKTSHGGEKIAALLNHIEKASPANRRILVRSPERILFLKPEEIDYVEAAGNYVVLHAGKERHVLRETTAAMETRLASAGFMRISRSAIVNLAQIREVQPIAPGQYCVLLKNGARLDMTCGLGELQARMSES